jgi:hypothetical protein
LAPTRHGSAVAPEDVIDLTGGLSDEAQRLVAEHRQATQAGCFATLSDLDPGLSAHCSWTWLCENTFSSRESGLKRLVLLLEDLPSKHDPSYHIGDWREPPKPETISLLARCDQLPGWRLLQQASLAPFDLATAWYKLRKALAQKLPSEAIVSVLDWITSDTTEWDVRKEACDAYLQQLTETLAATPVQLHGRRLASRARKWRPSTELCAGAPGIDADWLLDDHQSAILKNWIYHADQRPAELDPDTLKPLTFTEFDRASQDAPKHLLAYFKRWEGGVVPAPMIGVILGLFGRRLRELSEQYLTPHSFDPWVIQQLPHPTGATVGGSDETREQYLRSLLELITLVVNEATGDKIDALNLFEQSVFVPLEQNFQTLIAGFRWEGANRVRITLRHIEPRKLPRDRLSRLLQGTAEEFYLRYYCRSIGRIDFSRLWQELDRSDQLEIETARNLILEYLPRDLRRLSLDSVSLQEMLKDWDTQRRKVEEAKAAGRGESSQRAALSKILQKLAASLVQDTGIQQSVLAGVKTKLDQLEYDTSSIPFEIFQNADDAAVELGQMEAHPLNGCNIPEESRRFILVVDHQGLRFLHWGRPINARGPVGFDGERRGYGRDLEKMLTLFDSDKPGNPAVTGKYGLGFKSVLLACDRPRILSGRLAVEVVAGLLPEPWSDTNSAYDCLMRHAEGALQTGTLIELPMVFPDLPLLERFTQLAGVLCVFGQAIRTIAIHQTTPDGGQPDATLSLTGGDSKHFSWEARELCPGVECGRLDLRSHWGAETQALCLRTASGAILMALGPEGVRPLPKLVPSLWVTAPTRKQADLGFAINGRGFDLNVGRAQLTSKHENQVLAQAIGLEAGEVLNELFQRSQDNWSEVRQQLGLAADVPVHDFWHGLWAGLTNGCIKRSPAEAEVVTIGREVIFALLKRLCDGAQAIPNGLATPFQSFISARDAHYVLDKSLAEPPIFSLVGQWDRFQAKYPANALVVPDIGQILKQADLARPATLGLTALIAALDPPRVRPEDARMLGRILQLTEDTADWDSKEVKEKLKRLQFRTEADDGWSEVGNLLANDGQLIKKEESLRHNVAPSIHRLHPDYYLDDDESAPAIEFFLACRGPLQAPAEKMAKWILAAASSVEKQAALVYLAEGETANEVSKRVRGQGWLASVSNDEALLSNLNPEQVRELDRRLATDEEIAVARRLSATQLPSAPQPSPMKVATALERIHSWWQKEGAEHAARHRKQLYPQGALTLSEHPPDTGRYDHSSWLILFALGAFQSIGRTRNSQHRAAIEMCRDRGWWKTFAETDPRKEPDRWLQIIEDYANTQVDDEQWSLWMAQFPRLYRLSRWMSDYIDLFLSIDRFPKDQVLDLDLLLTPKANNHFNGTDFDTPPLNRTLKIGANLVIRELLYHGVISNPMAIPHAYAPIERIRDFFGQFGVSISSSEDIHECLVKHLGKKRAMFNGDYDIPLRLVAAGETPLNFYTEA